MAFRLGACSNFARASSDIVEVRRFLYFEDARRSSCDLPTQAKGPEGPVSRLESNGTHSIRIGTN